MHEDLTIGVVQYLMLTIALSSKNWGPHMAGAGDQGGGGHQEVTVPGGRPHQQPHIGVASSLAQPHADALVVTSGSCPAQTVRCWHAHDRLSFEARVRMLAQVWGSWWSGGQWGYACCHQSVKNSYCTGSAGETAAQEAAEQMQANLDARAREARAPDADAAAASTSAAVRPCSKAGL